MLLSYPCKPLQCGLSGDSDRILVSIVEAHSKKKVSVWSGFRPNQRIALFQMDTGSAGKHVENPRGHTGPIDIWNEQAWCLRFAQVTVHAGGSDALLFGGENRITAGSD